MAIGLQRYRCKARGKTFNVLSDTPFARLNLLHKLSQYAQCMEEGVIFREADRQELAGQWIRNAQWPLYSSVLTVQGMERVQSSATLHGRIHELL